MTALKNWKFARGFTLIELLIVMAILGVLAVVVLVAINPVQQLARTRDAGRKSGVTQMGHAAEAFYTARGGTYLNTTNCPGLAGGWVSCLVTAGELSTVPSAIAYSVSGISACTTNVQANWCYNVNAASDQAIIHSRLESQSEISKCSSGNPYFVWSTADGRGGLVCSATEPAVGAQTWNPVQ